MANDWIMDQIEMMTRFLGKVFFHKDLKPEEYERLEAGAMDEGDLVSLAVKRLCANHRFNEAENLIFEEVAKEASPRMLQIACWFYRMAAGCDDETLLAAGFGREEIKEGLGDLGRIYGISGLDTSSL